MLLFYHIFSLLSPGFLEISRNFPIFCRLRRKGFPICIFSVTKHRHKVIAACFKAGIGWQGLRHDLSKYSPVEFLPGARNYQGFRSPNEVEREKLGYSPAWLHHKGRNRHHFEYWNDYNPKEKRVMPVKMPRKYVAEMF